MEIVNELNVVDMFVFLLELLSYIKVLLSVLLLIMEMGIIVSWEK